MKKTKEEMLEDYVNFAKELGRTPTCRDVDNKVGMASSYQYQRHFGSLTNVAIQAGLQPNLKRGKGTKERTTLNITNHRVKLKALLDAGLTLRYIYQSTELPRALLESILRGDVNEVFEDQAKKLRDFIESNQCMLGLTPEKTAQLLQERLQKALPKEKVTIKWHGDGLWQYTVEVHGRVSFGWKTGLEYFETEESTRNEIKSIIRYMMTVMVRQNTKKIDLSMFGECG